MGSSFQKRRWWALASWTWGARDTEHYRYPCDDPHQFKPADLVRIVT